MKNLMIFLVILAASAAFAEETRDVVYLRNGSVIRGTITEIFPDSILKVQTSDGSVFVWKMTEVEKTVKDTTASAAPSPTPPPSPPDSVPAPSKVKIKGRKNPYVSGVLSFFLTGGGQFYNREFSKGLIQIAMVIVGTKAMIDGKEEKTTYLGGGYYHYEEKPTHIYWFGFAIAGGTRIWSIIDAPVSSMKINRQKEEAAQKVGMNFVPIQRGGMMVLAYRF